MWRKLKKQTAHGEGHIKRFSDTGSTPVTSTKEKKRSLRALFLFGEGDTQVDTAMRKHRTGAKKRC